MMNYCFNIFSKNKEQISNFFSQLFDVPISIQANEYGGQQLLLEYKGIGISFRDREISVNSSDHNQCNDNHSTSISIYVKSKEELIKFLANATFLNYRMGDKFKITESKSNSQFIVIDIDNRVWEFLSD